MSFILLTRPLDDANELEKNLSVPVLKAPLLTIELIPEQEKEDPQEYTGLIVTSARALMIFSQTNSFLKKPIWCVGHKTAITAKKIGFETIYTADNSAEDLYRQILEKTSISTEKFLHICGESLHFDIVASLLEAGYQAKKKIIYKTLPAENLSESVLEAFKDGKIKLIPLYSRKTAEILTILIEHHKLEDSLQTVSLLSCNSMILESLQKFKWQKVIMKKDLSSQTLEKVFKEIDTQQEIKMSPKYFWTLMGGTAALSSLISIGCFYILSDSLPSQIPSLHTEEVEKIVAKALAQQKPASHSSDHLNTQIAELKTELIAVKEAIETVKQQQTNMPSSASPSEASSQAIGIGDDSLQKASLLVSTLLENLDHDIEIPTSLWQQLPKAIEKTSLSLSEKMKNISDLPVPTQKLLQEIQALDIKEEPSVVPPSSNEAGTKISHPLLEKFENFIGQIAIHQDTPEKETPATPALKVKATMAIQSQNRDELTQLLQDSNTPESLKNLLRQAESRLVLTEELIKLKQELLKKIFTGEE